MSADALSCGNCRQPMQRLALAGHYGQRVELDLCAPCHQIWFDAIESARLSGPALLDLLAAMAAAQIEPHHALGPAVECPRCRAALRPVHNRTRWGRTTQLECPQRHGTLQSFAQLLAEKGLVRPMAGIDRAAEGDAAPTCLNCGAGLGTGAATCSHCGTQPALFDVARLAHALDPEGATRAHAVHRTAPQRAALPCFACGAPTTAAARVCSHCGATQAARGLRGHAARLPLEPDVHVALGDAVVERERVLHRGERPIVVALGLQRHAEVGPRAREPGLDLDRAALRGDRLVVAREAPEDPAQPRVRLGMVGRHRDGAAQRRLGFAQPPRLLQAHGAGEHFACAARAGEGGVGRHRRHDSKPGGGTSRRARMLL